MFHKIIHLDRTLSWQVTSDCENLSNMIHKSWFYLPPVEEYYYKTSNPNYSIIPPLLLHTHLAESMHDMKLTQAFTEKNGYSINEEITSTNRINQDRIDRQTKHLNNIYNNLDFPIVANYGLEDNASTIILPAQDMINS